MWRWSSPASAASGTKKPRFFNLFHAITVWSHEKATSTHSHFHHIEYIYIFLIAISEKHH
jgi:hypothetical protein